jgi:ubiquinone/menaquinone biosynthesis C-methylase UbiE
MKSNKDTYQSAKVVQFYARYEQLQKPEEEILKILRGKLAGMKMLDIGIGAGRTTAWFAPLVQEYVGIDYAQGMVDACIEKFKEGFPNSRFLQADVRHLDEFPSGYFDFVLFSFNGIDYILPEERAAALQQVRRVLRRGGYFCFSTHNLISLYDLHAFELRLNLVAAIRRALDVRKIKRINKAQLNTVHAANYIIINDGAHDFRLETVYVRPSFQLQQLSKVGYSNVRAFALTTGKEIDPNNDLGSEKEKWIYFLCENN